MSGGKASEADCMTPEPCSYHRHRFPAEIISHVVWLYHVFSLSLRDVGLILAEWGTAEGPVVDRASSLAPRGHAETPVRPTRKAEVSLRRLQPSRPAMRAEATRGLWYSA